MADGQRFKTDHPDAVIGRLERIRQSLGFSQSRMAKALGVPFRTYQKWLYSAQKPRHATALLTQAEAMAGPRRANCWEMLKCGREPGGENVDERGPCPAATDDSASGVNSGTNGGRICWAISGTFCGMQVEGDQAARLISCLSCDVFGQILQEEGLANFKLLKPGQTYTQR